jgi:hypothetical protein
VACSAAKKGSGSDGTCGPIKFDTDPDDECFGGGCNGNSACGYYNGVLCNAGTQCLSTYCVDGYCCNHTCLGTCQACSLAKKGTGFDGVCGYVKSNTDPDNECPGDQVCHGDESCSGSLRLGSPCSNNNECWSSKCIDGVCCNVACGGICQACTAAKKGGGADGTCGSIGAGLDPDNECAGTCNGLGACSKSSILLGLGGDCSLASECVSGFCVDGVCCNSACTSTCNACSTVKKGGGADGTCGNVGAGTDPDNECSLGSCNGSGACNASIGGGNGAQANFQRNLKI